ncbi:hypothetical protein CAP35_02190 [Chitinophagaceae bacterium IBVUCB1]|nr:hypothetical protein CAP35_02190 [Chitinophagaceae bacterium IBVUCB1]
MKHTLCIAFMALSVMACNSANTERPSDKYEAKKKSLEETERENPLQFLRIQGDNHVNLLNQEVVEGEITNKATLASFKDVEVRITFKSKTGSTIEKAVKTVNEVVAPQESVSFKFKMKKPKGTASVAVDIISAVPDK